MVERKESQKKKISCSFYLFFIFQLCTVFSTNSLGQATEERYKMMVGHYDLQQYEAALEDGLAYLEDSQRQDTSYARVLNYISYASFFLTDYERACEYAKQERELRLSIQGKDHQDTKTVTYSLGSFYTYLGDYASAAPLMRESLGWFREYYEVSSEEYINMQTTVASVYEQAGSYKRAEEIYDAVYVTMQRDYDIHDSLYQALVPTLSTFYNTHGLFEKAEPFFLHSVATWEADVGRKSEGFILAKNALGEFYIYAGWYEKAAETFESYLEDVLNYFGKKSPDHATALNNIAVAYEKLGRNEEAEDLYLECLKIKAKCTGKESEFYALSLGNLSVLYDNMGRFEEAEELGEETIKIYQTLYGENNENYATALSNMGSLYSQSGKYEKGIELVEEALAIQKEIYNGYYSGALNTLNNLAHLHRDAGNYETADSLFVKIVELGREQYGEEHPTYGLFLRNLASMKSGLGKYRQAEELIQEALQVQEKSVGRRHPDYVTALQTLASNYHDYGNFIRAEETYTEVLELGEKVYGKLHPDYAVALGNYGYLLFEKGDYRRSENLILEALQIGNGVYGEEHPNNIPLITYLAQIYQAKNEYSKAEEKYMEGSRIAQAFYGKDHPSFVVTYSNLGAFYLEIGSYEKSEEFFKRSLDENRRLYGEGHKEYSLALNNLATLYMSMALESKKEKEEREYSSKANSLYEECLKVDSLADLVDHPDHAAHLNNLAEMHRALQEFEAAEKWYLKCLEIEEKAFGPNSINAAITYHNLGLLYSGQGAFERGEQYLSKSLAIKEEVYGENSVSNLSSYTSMAYIKEQAGHVEGAFEYYRKALRSRNDLITNAFTFMSEEEKLNFLKTTKSTQDMFSAFAVDHKKEIPNISGMLYNLELKNKAALLKSSNKMREAILSSNDQELMDTYTEWIAQRQQLSKLYAQPKVSREVSVEEVENELDQLEKRLITASSEFGALREEKGSWVVVRDALQPKEAAIEFIVYSDLSKNDEEDVYAALLLRNNSQEPEMIQLFHEKDISELLNITSGTTISFVEKIYGNEQNGSSPLYELLWSHLDSALNGMETIYLANTGLTHKVSHAGIRDRNGRYLAEKYQLVQLSSTLEIGEKEKQKRQKLDLCLFGGAIYQTEDSEMEVWKYLEGTRKEVEEIAATAVEIEISHQLFLGERASEEAFKQLDSAVSPAVLHFATHGFFYVSPDELRKDNADEVEDLAFRGGGKGISSFVNNPNPLMRSGIALSGANDVWSRSNFTGEDGVVTAFEVSNMRLDETDLVVLSACETGLGDIEGSEGVYGLQRAFKIAGVDKLMMSLWQVPDKETSEFMISFYAYLFELKDVRQSFERAQKDMIDRYEPYYWAAFVLIE